MENQNKDKKQNNEIIPQGLNEVESLNDSKELDLETLEEIDGGLALDGGCCGSNQGCIDHCWH